MIPSIIFDARLILSHENNFCGDYFQSRLNEENNENEMDDDAGLVLGYQALLVL